MVITLALAAAFCLGFISKPEKETMKVGAFSISLSVKDLKASKEFYENRNVKIEGSYKIGSYVDCCFAGPCRSFYFYKVGQWKYYNSAGELDYEIEFTPATLRIDTRCEGGDTLIFGLIKTIPVKYWSKLTADKVYELQKISVRYRDSFGTTTYIPLNEELFIEFKADE